MKSKLTLIGLAFALASAANADVNPVPLTSDSYTFAIVVPSNTVQALPYCLNADTGSGTAFTNSSFYEQGFYAQPGQLNGFFGIPRHNTTFTNINNPNIVFLMPPDYTTNNDLQIDSQTYTSGTLTFETATSATNLAILACDGNGDNYFQYTVHHTDGSTQDSGYVFVPDWFDGGSGTNSNFNGVNTTHDVAWGADDRVVTGCELGCDYLGFFYDYGGIGGDFNNNNPYLYCLNIPVSDTNPITSIDINWYAYHPGSVGNFYAVSGNNSGTNWTPIPVSGFNQITTVAATVPYPVTATMDDGVNLNNPGNTWFEQGYDRGNTSDGLPPSGSTFTSQTQPTHHYQMGNYSANNAVLIDTNHLTTNMAPANPALYSAFALLTAGGNIGSGNEMVNTCILQHEDGSTETNDFNGYDWLETGVPGAVAWGANGRVYLNNRTLNDLNEVSGVPYLFESYFTVNNTNSVVTNIVVRYGSAPYEDSSTYIMAVSATVIVATPAFSAVASEITTYGAAVTLSGRVSAPGIVYPAAGETISVAVNGNTQTTTINDSTGDFAVSYNPSTIPARGTPYTVAFSYAGDANLFGATNTATTLTVNRTPLAITAVPQAVPYGTSVPATTVTYGGFVNGETNTALTTQPLVISDRNGVVAAGSYPGNYVPGGAAGSNYNISYFNGTLTVNRAALIITALPQSIPYGTTVPATTVTYGGFVNGETNTALTAQPGILSGKSGVTAAGSYPGNYVPSGAADNDYNISYVNGTLTVNPLAVILTGTNEYNGTSNVVGTNLVVANAVGGDNVKVASGDAVMNSADIGSNAITSVGNLALGNSTASNYTLIGASGSVLVTPLPVTLTGAREFDGTSNADASILTVVTNYDGTNLTLSGSAGLAGSTVGAQNITGFAGLTLGGTAASNYTVTGASGSVTIANGSITVIDGLVLATNGYGTIQHAAWPNELVIGKKYSVTAVPNPQNLLFYWIGGTAPPYSTLSTSATFKFTMESNLVLVADFVTNMFPSSAGVYNGLFITSNGVTEQTAGMLRTLTVTTKGTYSGTLLINGAGHAISGAFSPIGQATNRIARAAGQGGPVTLLMTLNWNQSPPQVTGTVAGTNNGVPWTATLLADLAANTLPPAEYTMLMGPDTNNAPPHSSPGGDGYALITNSATAAIITGDLADGVSFRQSVPVSQGGYVPIYANLYASKGLLLGWINLSLTNTSGVGLTWIHPQARSGLYQQGFTNVLQSDQILLSPWSDPPASIDLLTNLSFLGTIDSSNSVDLAVTTTTAGRVTGALVNGAINPATGLLTVTVGSGPTKLTGYGAVLLNATNGGGYFLTKTNAQAFQLGQ